MTRNEQSGRAGWITSQHSSPVGIEPMPLPIPGGTAAPLSSSDTRLYRHHGGTGVSVPADPNGVEEYSQGRSPWVSDGLGNVGGRKERIGPRSSFPLTDHRGLGRLRKPGAGPRAICLHPFGGCPGIVRQSSHFLLFYPRILVH